MSVVAGASAPLPTKSNQPAPRHHDRDAASVRPRLTLTPVELADFES